MKLFFLKFFSLLKIFIIEFQNTIISLVRIIFDTKLILIIKRLESDKISDSTNCIILANGPSLNLI